MAAIVPALSPTGRHTIDDLDNFPDDGKLRELVDGRIVEWDVPSQEHGAFQALLTAELVQFVRRHKLGKVTSGDGMVRILSSVQDARGGDIEFFSRGRFPKDARAPATVVAPDLVVGLVSPSDRADQMLEKVRDWLRTGVRLLWYIDPATGNTTVYQGDHMTHIAADDVLDGGDVLPGLRLRLRDLLQEISAE